MPCNCDHMNPDQYESESKRVANLIVFADSFYKGITPKWIRIAANNYYGNKDKVHELTEILCTKCKNMSKGQQDHIIYNGRNKNSRDLAGWWENHQLEDQKKEQKILAQIKEERIKKRALSKLTDEERSVLGFD